MGQFQWPIACSATQPAGGIFGQARWPGVRVGCRLALFYINQNDNTNTINTVIIIIIIIKAMGQIPHSTERISGY